MSVGLTDFGEEFIVRKNVDGSFFVVGLYNDGVDSLSDDDDIDSITTEPDSETYIRKDGVSLSLVYDSGSWKLDNDSKVTFDVSGEFVDVDSYFFVNSFQSLRSDDVGLEEHLILGGSLSQVHDLSNFDTLKLDSNSVGVRVL